MMKHRARLFLLVLGVTAIAAVTGALVRRRAGQQPTRRLPGRDDARGVTRARSPATAPSSVRRDAHRDSGCQRRHDGRHSRARSLGEHLGTRSSPTSSRPRSRLSRRSISAGTGPASSRTRAPPQRPPGVALGGTQGKPYRIHRRDHRCQHQRRQPARSAESRRRSRLSAHSTNKRALALFTDGQTSRRMPWLRQRPPRQRPNRTSASRRSASALTLRHARHADVGKPQHRTTTSPVPPVSARPSSFPTSARQSPFRQRSPSPRHRVDVHVSSECERVDAARWVLTGGRDRSRGRGAARRNGNSRLHGNAQRLGPVLRHRGDDQHERVDGHRRHRHDHVACHEDDRGAPV